MELNFEKILHDFENFIKNEVKTETVVGKPFTLGEYTCVPVVKVGIGFGGGGGAGANEKAGKGEGAGGGVGFGIQPIGFLASRGEHITMIHIGRETAMNAIFDKAPGLIEKFFEQRAAKAEKSEKPKE